MTHLFDTRLRPIFITVSVIMMIYLLFGVSRGESWVKYEDTQFGFSVEHPPEWTAKVDSSNHIVVMNPDGKAAVIVYPFIQQTNMNASNYVNAYTTNISMSPYCENVNQGFIRQLDNSNASGLDQASGSIAYTLVSNGTRFKEGILISIYQQSGMFYSIIAPEDKFEDMRGTLIQILQTLSFTQPSNNYTLPLSQGDAGIRYMQWLEPRENAFTMEVPEAWNVAGGVERYPAGQIGLYEGARTILRVTSQDGIIITVGDNNVPFFQTPTQLTQNLGLTEGTMMSNRQMIMRKMSGAEFAKVYVENYLTREYGYTDVVIVENKGLPERSKAINDYYKSVGFPTYLDIGEVYFTCSKDGRALNGYYLVSIKSTSLAGTGSELWNAPFIVGYVSPASQENLASSVLAHIISSYKINVIWMKKAVDSAEKVAQAVSAANAEFSDAIMKDFQTRSQIYDNIYRKSDNAVLGQTDLVSPNGETFKVEAGHNYYWRKGPTGDTIVSTETYDRPDTDFEPLQEF